MIFSWPVCRPVHTIENVNLQKLILYFLSFLVTWWNVVEGWLYEQEEVGESRDAFMQIVPLFKYS